MINKVSFIVPVYNVSVKYLSSCLKSVNAGAKTINYEIIVCNDGSDRHHSYSYDKLVNEIGNIKYMKMDYNKGINHARNICLNESDGDWIALLDADDELTNDFGNKVKSHLSQDYALIYADHIQYDQNLTYPIQKRKKNIYSNLLLEYGGTELDPLLWSTFIFHPQIFKKDALEKIGGFNTEISSGDEVDAHITIAEKYGIQSLHHVPEYLYKYRNNYSSVVHNETYYSNLISNIEVIMASHYSKRTGVQTRAQRVGRCITTNAAHYIHVMDCGEVITPPWFNLDRMSISFKNILNFNAHQKSSH